VIYLRLTKKKKKIFTYSVRSTVKVFIQFVAFELVKTQLVAFN